MIGLTIGIIGRISVGKSSIAKLLSKTTGIPHRSFGTHLVKYSILNGMPVDRKSLQDLGEKFINENPGQFLQNVIGVGLGTESRIIIEGIRHSIIVNKIADSSNKAFFVFLEGAVSTRYNRYMQRKKENDVILHFDEFVEKDSHKVESEIELLKAFCNLTINTEQLNIEQTVNAITSHFQLM